MGMAGWGAGLSAAGQGIGELMQQRKMEQMRLEAEARQKEAIQREMAQQKVENEFKQRQMALQEQQGQQSASSNAIMRANQVDTQTPLAPDMVADLQKTGNSGMIRTVGAGQTALPSSRWQGDLYTKTQDPGASQGQYRQASPSERVLEDQQTEKRTAAAENMRFRDRELQSQQQSRASESALKRESDAQRQREHDETTGYLRSIATGQGQQRLDMDREKLNLTKQTAAEKKAEAESEKGKKQAVAAGGAEDIKAVVDELDKHPGFDNLFGRFDAITPNLRGVTMDAQARLDQLRSALSIEKIMEMKAQSRTGATGFGQLSERELDVLQNAAGRLQQAQTEAAARTALKDIKKTMDKVIERNQRPAAAGGLPTVGGVYNGEKVLSVTKE